MRIRMILTTFAGICAAALLAASPASASVTFDPSSGSGFVGKGDVQLAFGWNNAQAQTNAAAVSFTYNATDTYEGVCTWVTGEGTRGERTHNVTVPRHTTVTDAIAYDARTHKQVDGFNLLAFGASTTDGTVPVVGAACVGDGGSVGTWTSVVLVSSAGALYVNYGATSVLLQ